MGAVLILSPLFVQMCFGNIQSLVFHFKQTVSHYSQDLSIQCPFVSGECVKAIEVGEAKH